jgi:hypothetical protein
MWLSADYALPVLQTFVEAEAEKARPKPQVSALPAYAVSNQPAKTEQPDAGNKENSAKLRDALRAEYQGFVAEQYSHLNGIQTKITKTKHVYALWATHEFFGRYTFSAGRQAHSVDQWIYKNRVRLQQAGLTRVGVMSSERFGELCWFDIRE